jgi:hypothetical protein
MPNCSVFANFHGQKMNFLARVVAFFADHHWQNPVSVRNLAATSLNTSNLDSGVWILDFSSLDCTAWIFYHNASTAGMELVCRGLSEMRKKVKMENSCSASMASGEKSPGKSPGFYRRFYDRMLKEKIHPNGVRQSTIKPVPRQSFVIHPNGGWRQSTIKPVPRQSFVIHPNGGWRQSTIKPVPRRSFVIQPNGGWWQSTIKPVPRRSFVIHPNGGWWQSTIKPLTRQSFVIHRTVVGGSLR